VAPDEAGAGKRRGPRPEGRATRTNRRVLRAGAAQEGFGRLRRTCGGPIARVARAARRTKGRG
jgi:hypothetical protein